MSEMVTQVQLDEVNRKLDLLLEEVTLQRAKREEMEDLMEDLQLVGKDMFQAAVTELDKAGVEVNGECVARLGVNLVRNVPAFNQLLASLESMNDFISDITPILRQVGLDAIHKLAEFEQKGYFDYLAELGRLAETFMKSYSVDDLKRLNNDLPILVSAMRNISTRENLEALERATRVMNAVKMDDTVDNKSLFKIYKELKSPEVRKSLSYSLRLVREIVKANQQHKNN